MSRASQADQRLYNAIETVLEGMHPKASQAERMADLRARYPSPVFFIESSTYMLERAGLPRLDAFYFTMIPEFARLRRREEFGKRPRLDTLSRMAPYLRTLFIGVHVEHFYAVLLDGRGCLIDAALISRGTTDAAMFDLKALLSIVVRREARAVVMCHNHPCGTLEPSEADTACTAAALKALKALGVPLLDHVIIANRHAVSMREIGVPGARLWIDQAPNSRVNRAWLDVELLG